jgi:hypothetical protein
MGFIRVADKCWECNNLRYILKVDKGMMQRSPLLYSDLCLGLKD